MNRLWEQWDRQAHTLDLPMYGSLRPRPPRVNDDGAGGGARLEVRS
jgi:hypothetical protein